MGQKYMQANMVKRYLEFQKKIDNLCKGVAIPPLYRGGHMSKKIDYSHNIKIENNSFGNGTQIADVIVNNCVEQKEQQNRAVYTPEKRIPVLECKRNSNHYYVVDYTEDRV